MAICLFFIGYCSFNFLEEADCAFHPIFLFKMERARKADYIVLLVFPQAY